MIGWRYIAARMNGDGTESSFTEVPLSNVEYEERLSGPDGLTADIEPEILTLKDDQGRPIFKRWQTTIYIEKDNQIRGGAILVDYDTEGGKLSLDCAGHSVYPQGMAYTSETNFVQADPLNIVRHIWSHLQSQPMGDIGVIVDGLTTPIRVGTNPKDVQFTTGAGQDVAFEAGPYKLNFFSTFDLGKKIDELAKGTPFDYRMEHTWTGSGQIKHRLVLGYPRIGRRRSDLRFAVGENVFVKPKYLYSGDTYADEIIVLGAGEGRTMVRGAAIRRGERIRRTHVIEDKGIRSVNQAKSLAARAVKRTTGELDIESFTVLMDHDNAKFGSYEVGDDVLLTNYDGWSSLSVWVRILAITVKPEDSEVTIDVARADKVG